MRYRNKVRIKAIVMGTFMWVFNLSILAVIIILITILGNHAHDRILQRQMYMNKCK